MYLNQIESYRPRNAQERTDKRIIYHYALENAHNILLRTNEVAHLTSSGFIMNENLDKVLMIYHKIYQAWGWTGGHADGANDLLHVAIKEAKEETGLENIRPLSKQMMSIDILPVWGHYKNDHYVAAHLHYNASYVLIADEKASLTVNLNETEGLKWVQINEISSVCDEPELVIVYNKLIEAAKAYDRNQEKEIIQPKKKEAYSSLTSALKETAIPIALHETQSAYYKAKLAKEVVVRGTKAIKNKTKQLFKQKKKDS